MAMKLSIHPDAGDNNESLLEEVALQISREERRLTTGTRADEAFRRGRISGLRSALSLIDVAVRCNYTGSPVEQRDPKTILEEMEPADPRSRYGEDRP